MNKKHRDLSYLACSLRYAVFSPWTVCMDPPPPPIMVQLSMITAKILFEKQKQQEVTK